MKRILSAILLTFVCSVAYAEWLAVTSSKDGSFTLYADPSTVKRSGDIVRVWVMADYKNAKTINSINYLSTKRQHQFNCKEDLLRLVYVAIYEGNMGGGKLVQSVNEPNQEWSPVVPNTMNSDIFDFACQK